MLLHKGNTTFLPDPWMEQTSQNSLGMELNPKSVSKQLSHSLHSWSHLLLSCNVRKAWSLSGLPALTPAAEHPFIFLLCDSRMTELSSHHLPVARN